MNYIKQMNEFLAIARDLSGAAAKMYLALFEEANRKGWPDEIEMSDRHLMNYLQTDSKNAISLAKKELKNAGLIEISARPKVRTRYALIDLVGADDGADFGAVIGADDGADFGADSRVSSLIKLKHKHKTETIYNTYNARAREDEIEPAESPAEEAEPNPFINPPTLEEVKAEAEENGYHNVDCEYFYRYYSGTQWQDTGGNSILGVWKVKLMAWNKREAERTVRNGRASGNIGYRSTSDAVKKLGEESERRKQFVSGWMADIERQYTDGISVC